MNTETEKQPEWLPFDYDSFYDLPRRMRAKTNDAVYFLDCPFNDNLDDYEESYEIYRIVGSRAEDAANTYQWSQFLSAGSRVGSVKVKYVRFDATKRKFVHKTALWL